MNRIIRIWVALACLSALTAPANAFEFKGFMDAGYQGSGSRRSTTALKNGGFTLGGLDLYAAHEIGDRIDVLAELVFEAPAGSIIVDLERAEVGYAVYGDFLNVRMGRYHNPMGRYSATYHHGRQLESAIGRPLILEFEDAGGLVPAHIVGLWARGIWTGDHGALKYNAGLANGEKLDIDNSELLINMSSDDNRNKAVLGSLTFEPAGPLEGLGVGVSFYKSKVDGYTTAGGTTSVLHVDQFITGVNAYYIRGPAELMWEHYALADRNLTASGRPRATAVGYFIQASYEVRRILRPYARFEEVRPKDDAYAAALVGTAPIKRATYGLRYNLSIASAIKAEGIYESRGSVKDVPSFGLQWTYAF